MGIVLRFPIERRMSRNTELPGAPAQIVILPCVRIERHAEPVITLPAPRERRPSVRGRRRLDKHDAAET